MEIREIQNDDSEIKSVQDFLFSQIRIEYGIGPTPKFHYDILDMKKYYVIPDRNAFFAAYDGDNIIATAGVRAYDKDYEFFKDCYNEDYTASIWRLMVDSEHRRKGLARSLVKEIAIFLFILEYYIRICKKSRKRNYKISLSFVQFQD